MNIMSKKSKESNEPKVSLGQALKDCRLVAKLSIESVANSLNLKSTLIRDLEENLDEIIEQETYPKIYLRGYLANYAKEIGLSNIGTFPQFQQLSIPVKSVAHLRSPDIIPAKKGLPVKLKLAIAALVIIPLLAISLFWLLSTPAKPPQVETPQTENQQMRLPNPSAEIANTEIANTESNQAEQVSESQQQVAEQIQQTSESPSLSSPDDSSAVQQPETKLESVTDEQQQTAAPEITTITIQSEILIQPEEVETVSATLRLSFKEECWTEVYDANGKKLALDLYQPGRELTLAGQPPFNLKLGNPSAVDIYYQDKLVEKQFKLGRTANFTLPE